MVGQEFHVGRAVEEHFAGNGWQRVRQVPQLVIPVGEAAVVLEFADTCLHEVAADLGFVVGVDSADVVAARVVFRHWIVDSTSLLISMGEGASVTQAASLVLLKVATQGCLVLDVRHLVLVVSLIEVAFFASLTVLISLLRLGPIITFMLVTCV